MGLVYYHKTLDCIIVIESDKYSDFVIWFWFSVKDRSNDWHFLGEL